MATLYEAILIAECRSDPVLAAQISRDVYERAQAIGAGRIAVFALWQQATFCLTANDVGRASEIAERAMALAKENGLDTDYGIALRVKAGTLLRQQEQDAAREALTESQKILHNGGALFFRALSEADLGCLAARTGLQKEAVAWLSSAKSVFEQLGAIPALEEMSRRCGELQIDCSNIEGQS